MNDDQASAVERQSKRRRTPDEKEKYDALIVRLQKKHQVYSVGQNLAAEKEGVPASMMMVDTEDDLVAQQQQENVNDVDTTDPEEEEEEEEPQEDHLNHAEAETKQKEQDVLVFLSKQAHAKVGNNGKEEAEDDDDDDDDDDDQRWDEFKAEDEEEYREDPEGKTPHSSKKPSREVILEAIINDETRCRQIFRNGGAYRPRPMARVLSVEDDVRAGSTSKHLVESVAVPLSRVLKKGLPAHWTSFENDKGQLFFQLRAENDMYE